MTGVSRAKAIIITMDLVSRSMGASIPEIMDRLSCSRRTVYRILEDLPDMGCHVEPTPEPTDRRYHVWHRVSR